MLSDLLFAFRSLRKNPGFAAIVVVTLALGLGINAAMYSIASGIVWRALPLPQGERLVALFSHSPENPPESRTRLSWAEFEDYRAQQKSLEIASAYYDVTVTLSTDTLNPERLDGTYLTADGVALLGAPVVLGRWFTAAEDQPGAAPVVVLGHEVWEKFFQADPAVLGRAVKVNGVAATVIGVAPRGFKFPEVNQLWLPFRGRAAGEARSERNYVVFGRLAGGVTLAQAEAEAATIARRLEAEHPDTNKAVGFRVMGYRQFQVSTDDAVLVRVMLAAVGLVLLIACANVANLLLARSAARDKELAVRAALGAGRGRVLRLLLAETLVLCASGAVGGVAIAEGALVIFRHYIGRLTLPYFFTFELDGPALGHLGALTVGTALIAGLYPAWRASRPDLNTALKDASRGSTGSRGRLARVLVFGEVVFSCLLLVLSALTIRTVMQMQSLPLGYSTEGIYTGRVALPEKEYATPEQQMTFVQQLTDHLRARSEIAGVAASDLTPQWTNRSAISLEGRAPEPEGRPALLADVRSVTENYFDVLRVPVLQGRGITAADDAAAPAVAVVSATFAANYFPGQDPLGRKFRIGRGAPDGKEKWITVVGLVPDSMRGRFERRNEPQVYLSLAQSGAQPRISFLVQGHSGDATLLAPVLRAAVRELNADLPVYFGKTMDELITEVRFNKQLLAGIFTVFGGIALVLAAVGLYGVISYSVAQRTQEIGVRVALGATRGNVLALVLRQGGWQLVLGLAAGLTLAFFASGVLGSVLYGVSPRDAAAFGGTAAALLLAGACAMLMPTLRALRVNPVVALRNE
ncbi:MAG: hypothetical protein C0518_06325 [Opitutus sp.]|nr:hypothetical protein [Opitutus sp.]